MFLVQIMVNATLDTIKKRRSITNFLSKAVNEKDLQDVLEAGRWTPSWLNKQPWKFIVVSDEIVRSQASIIVPTVFSSTIKTAPIFIAICVNPDVSPYHYIEEGAAATQNMALAAHSIGLGTIWIGAFSLINEKKSTERKLKELLKIPKKWRLISLLPLGYPKFKGRKTRKEINEIVDWNYFTTRDKKPLIREVYQKDSIKKILTPASTPPL
jgi:nitroreductase